MKLPGVWMSIIGMLKLPTIFDLQVAHSCGKYWQHARARLNIPAQVAQILKSLMVGCSPEWDGGVPEGSPMVALGSERSRQKVMKSEETKWMTTTMASMREIVYSLESVRGVNRVAEGGNTLDGSNEDESLLLMSDATDEKLEDRRRKSAREADVCFDVAE